MRDRRFHTALIGGLLFIFLAACEPTPTPLPILFTPDPTPTPETLLAPLRVGIPTADLPILQPFLALPQNATLISAGEPPPQTLLGTSYELVMRLGTAEGGSQFSASLRLEADLLTESLPDAANLPDLLFDALAHVDWPAALSRPGIEMLIQADAAPADIRVALANAGFPDGLILNVASELPAVFPNFSAAAEDGLQRSGFSLRWLNSSAAQISNSAQLRLALRLLDQPETPAPGASVGLAQIPIVYWTTGAAQIETSAGQITIQRAAS